MHTLLIEFLRLGKMETGLLREGDQYLVAAGSEQPIRQMSSSLEHEQFLDLTGPLRYQSEPEARQTALQAIGETAAKLLGTRSMDVLAHGPFPLQIDLVVNPHEVAALPFEAATDDDGTPLFTRAEQAVVLTRRVRHTFAEGRVRWPAKPRLLYAWAAPTGAGDVPAGAHEAALRDALAPWTPIAAAGSTNDTTVIAILPEATLAQLKQACQTSVDESNPFTHVHLLMHGNPVERSEERRVGKECA